MIGDAEVANQTSRMQVFERFGHLVGLDQRIGTVQQQHIEPVRTQGTNRCGGRLDDVLLGEVEIAVRSISLLADPDL
jgi:hypothetical protein